MILSCRHHVVQAHPIQRDPRGSNQRHDQFFAVLGAIHSSYTVQSSVQAEGEGCDVTGGPDRRKHAYFGWRCAGVEQPSRNQ